MSLLHTAASFIVALGVLIVVHEYGHYLVARWCGVRVLRFSVGFGRPLATWRLGRDATEWSIGAIPFGGYVKMLDEREAPVNALETHRAFNRQSVGRRCLIVVAGPAFNFLFAIAVYAGLYMYGLPEARPVLAAPSAGTLAHAAGFGAGDLVRSIEGDAVATWQDLRWRVLQGALQREALRFEVSGTRGAIAMHVLDLRQYPSEDVESDTLERLGLRLYRPPLPPVIGRVVSGSAADRAGLRADDRVAQADGKDIANWEALVQAIRARPGEILRLIVERGATRLSVDVLPEAASENGVRIGRIGAAPSIPASESERIVVRVSYGPLDSLAKAAVKTWDISIFSLKMLGKMLLGEVSWKHLSGPVTIADYAGQSAQMGWLAYATFLALISISLGVLNLLPIPLLDGGHLMYYSVEIIKGSPVSERFMDLGQRVGLALLLVVMAFAFYNDLNRLFFGIVMRIRNLAVAACVLAMLAGTALGQSFRSFVVKDIRVEGLQRTEPGTVFSYLPVKVGETMTEEKAQQALRALFATGFFRDVRLEVQNDVLVVLVEERPSIAQIDFVGVKEFDSENLRRILRDVGLSEGRTFNRSVLEGAEQELKRQYLSRGLYAAQVQTTVTPLERNRVGISLNVVENDVAKIRSINIVGAQAYRESELLDQFVLRTPGWLTWYTKHDQYSKQRLGADLETLKSFYQDRGYLDFNIESTQVSITPDKKDIYITINVVEGEKYTVTAIKLDGQMLLPREELEKLVRIKPGEVFSRQRLTESTKAITDRLGNEGYAFANASAVPQIDKDKRSVAFSIVVDPGRRVYVRRINIAGNSRTRDEVVRREMRQLEGAYYDASRIQLSKTRIDRTQYFKEVGVETAPVADSPDQVDVNFTVEEKPTGAILLGAGFSSVDKLVLSGSVSQANVFGSGKFLSIQVNSGKVNKTYALSYLNPYFTVDGVSQGFDVYKRRVDSSSLSVGSYTTDTLGGGLKFGYPLSETDGVNFGLSGEHVKLGLIDTSPLSYRNFAAIFGTSYSYGTATAAWGRDSRDSGIMATSGGVTRVGLEVAGGNLQYYRVDASAQRFYALSRTMTLALNGEFGYVHGISGKPVPFFKNFYAGGPGSVRGYRAYSLGPQDLDANVLGGTRKITGSAEVLFPMPGAQSDKSLRLTAFIDAGQVYGVNQKLSLGDLRYSAGVGLAWGSPFGPLKISLAQPLNEKKGLDRIERLQLNFGAAL